MNKASKLREELAEEGKCQWCCCSEQTSAIERFVFGLRARFCFLRLPKAQAEVGRDPGHAWSTGAVRCNTLSCQLSPREIHAGLSRGWVCRGTELDPAAGADTGGEGGTANTAWDSGTPGCDCPTLFYSPALCIRFTKAATTHTVLCRA